MTIQLKVLIWFFVILLLFSLGFKRWTDKEAEREQYIQDSITTEQHREQRMLDWKSDSAEYEFRNSLDTVSARIEVWKDKANKYDSLINISK